MKFFTIEMLYLLWAIPVFGSLYYYGMRRRRRILKDYSSEHGLRSLCGGIRTRRRWIRACLVLCTAGFMVLALSGPQYGFRWQEIERKGIDIVIALDCSKSMLADDVQPTRLERAKREIYDLLGLLTGDRVGLVAFAGTAFMQCPLTLDYQAFYLFLETLTPAYLPVGGTDLSGALRTAETGFELNEKSEKAVILITDGEHTGEGDPLAAARSLEENGIKLFCIGVGKSEGTPVPDEKGGFKKDSSGKIVLSRLDEGTLQRMALLTRGAYVRSVAGDMDLEAIYNREIKGTMQATTLKSTRKQVWEDRFQWPLMVAIVLLIIDLCLPHRRKTIPILALTLFLAFPITAWAGDPMREGAEAYARGEYDRALKLFIDAQLEHPQDPEILYNLGNAHYKNGDFESAYHNYQETLNSEDRQLKQKAAYNLGNASFRQGRLDEAIKHYEAALEIDPQDIRARENIAYVKKVMQQQKPDQQQNDSPGGDQNKREDQEKQSPSQADGGSEANKTAEDQRKPGQHSSGPAPDDRDTASRDYGERMPDTQDENQGAENPDANMQPSRNRQGQQDRAPVSGEDDKTGQQQIGHVLDRLKDQPGRAMMPAYQAEEVVRDW